MRQQLRWFLLVVGALCTVSGGALAQPADEASLYADALGPGWVDGSSAPHSLTTSSPRASGSRSISVTFAPWTDLSFHHAGLPTSGLEALEFRVNGGANTHPLLTVHLTVSGQTRPAVQVAPYCQGGVIPTNAWTLCRVPLSALGASNGALEGVVLREGTGLSLAPLFVDAVRLVLALPAAPSDLAATASSTSVSLAWSTVPWVSGYNVYRATARLGPYTKLTPTPLTTSTYQDTTVTPGATYWYAVSGVNRRGVGSRSSPVRVIAMDPPPPSPPASGQKWVSGYYTGWNSGLYPADKVDFSAMTHIIVGRVTPNPDGTVNTNFDNPNGHKLARTLSTRAHAAGRKALIMVGGSGEYEGWVGAASDANRAKFVQNLLHAMDTFGYDGLDLDWEPVEDSDKPQLLALVKELRAARPNMLLTFPIGWINVNWQSNVDPWYAQLAPYLDQINVMSYSMVGPWPGWSSWYTSALYGHAGNHPTSVSASMEGWVNAGIPRAKLGIGIPFYGMAWRNITGPYQRFTHWSDFVGGDNSFHYKRILALAQQGGTHHWDPVAQASYITFSTPVGNDGTIRWISYDSPEAIAAKGQYVKDHGYGGTIIWTINQGCTDPVTGANPLLDAVKGAFLP